ncbi:Coiled-coil domain-containing protein 137, partial [Cathartes aura]
PCSFSPRKEKKLDNMKPKHPDEQEIPFRLRELIRSREAMKRPDPGKRRAAGGTRSWPEQGFPGAWPRSPPALRCCWRQPDPAVGHPAPPSFGGVPWGRNSLTCSWFQNKKLEKARKKKEEKKEAMLEKSLFQVPQSPVLAFSSFVLPDLSRLCPQAGRKRLLLTSRLGRSQASPESPAAPVSMARRRIVEEERARVIQAYRDIQRRKQQ